MAGQVNNPGLAALLLLFLLSSGIAAQQSVLDYESFLQDLVESHPLSKRGRNTKTYGAAQLRAARGEYDATVAGSYRNKYFQGTQYYSIAAAELRQPIFTSQYLKLGYDIAAGSFLNPQLLTPATGVPFAGIEVGLLQGLVIDERRARVLKARLFQNYHEAEGNMQLNELLFSAANFYIGWLLAQQKASLNLYYLEMATERFNGIKQLALAGEKPAIDTVEAAMQIQAREIEYSTTMQQLRTETNNLNYFLSPTALNSEGFKAKDSLELYFMRSRTNTAALVNNTYQNNPLLLQHLARQKAAEVDVLFRKELIKPQLDVSYNFLAGRNNLNDFVLSPNNSQWGLNVSFPLFFRKSVNEYRMARIVSMNAELELTNKANELQARLSAAVENIAEILKQLRAASQNAEFSKKMLNAELLRFEVGESSIFLINARENKQLDAELKLLELKAGFIKHILFIKFLNGDLNYTL